MKPPTYPLPSRVREYLLQKFRETGVCSPELQEDLVTLINTGGKAYAQIIGDYQEEEILWILCQLMKVRCSPIISQLETKINTLEDLNISGDDLDLHLLEGISKALINFDPGKGTSIVSYAFIWCKKYLWQECITNKDVFYVDKEGNTISVAQYAKLPRADRSKFKSARFVIPHQEEEFEYFNVGGNYGIARIKRD